ncbi:hypothetical protein K7X08_035838 [Anisodus acutangulus]|uniref:Uncharacterized protein n=1 Tax=Anisodus acutangulus TaxID=402998 RepID=A0A9Q1QWB6_9SOLA|nr:hypothetical protein K7X08_035838 [Anisodus acutangulus]
MVTYPKNPAKGNKISNGVNGVNKGKGKMIEKDIRRGDDINKGKENMVPAKGLVIQNNFNVLDNIVEEEISSDLNGGNNIATDIAVSKDVVDINKEMEKREVVDDKHNESCANQEIGVNSEAVKKGDALIVESNEEEKQTQEENNDAVIDYVDNLTKENNRPQ